MSYRQIVVATLTAGVITSAAVAGPADARVIEKFQEHRTPYSYTNTDCEDATYDIEGVFTGRFILRQGTGPATEAFPFLDRTSIVETWTNPETGGWFTFEANRIFHEVKARSVDGTVFEFHAVQAGRAVVRDSDGAMIATGTGAVRITFLFDTLGDGAPGGIYDFDSWVEDPRGVHQIGDLCALAGELTS